MNPSASNTFARRETKYRVDLAARDAISASAVRFLEAAVPASTIPLSDAGHTSHDATWAAARPATRVSSIYLDTPGRDVVSKSLDKPLYKEKLRLRIYGEGEPEEVFFELKKKFKGIVYKRRVGISLRAFLDELALCADASFADGCSRVNFCHFDVARAVSRAGLTDYSSRQVARELNAALARHEVLVPSMLITCGRISIGAAAPKTDVSDVCAGAAGSAAGGDSVGVSDCVAKTSAPGLQNADANAACASSTSLTSAGALAQDAAPTDDIRITIDTDLQYIDFAPREVAPHMPSLGTTDVPAREDFLQGLSVCRIIPANQAIIEIKTSRPYPAWLREVLDSTHTYPQSFSKYGTAATLEYGPDAAAAALGTDAATTRALHAAGAPGSTHGGHTGHSGHGASGGHGEHGGRAGRGGRGGRGEHTGHTPPSPPSPSLQNRDSTRGNVAHRRKRTGAAAT